MYLRPVYNVKSPAPFCQPSYHLCEPNVVEVKGLQMKDLLQWYAALLLFPIVLNYFDDSLVYFDKTVRLYTNTWPSTERPLLAMASRSVRFFFKFHSHKMCSLVDRKDTTTFSS